VRTSRTLAVAALTAIVSLGGTNMTASHASPRTAGPTNTTACPEPGVPHAPVPGPHVSRDLLAHLHCLLVFAWEYPLRWDGTFGLATQHAVAAHQRDCHVTATGVVDAETWRLLHPETTTAECADEGRA
jgi:hypothetical protein